MIVINYLMCVAKRCSGFANPVAHDVLVLSTNLWKGHVSSPVAVSSVVVGVAYDGVDFTDFPAVIKERHHNDTDSVAALNLTSLVD